MLPAEVVYRHPGFRLPYCGQAAAAGPVPAFLRGRPDALARRPVVGARRSHRSAVRRRLRARESASRCRGCCPRCFASARCSGSRRTSSRSATELARLAPQHHRDPRIVILTQEAGGHNYFEDAYVARYLGYTLVEAGDLAVRNNHVFMKTLGGLLPVDVLVRRPNSDECDPLELSERSAFGVAGLDERGPHRPRGGRQHAGQRAGRIAGVHGVSAELVPGAAGRAAVDAGRRHLVVRRQEVAADYVLEPPRSSSTSNMRIAAAASEHASAKELADLSRAELAERIVGRSGDYVAQERVTRSTAPTWSDGAARPAYVALRAFVVASGDGYTVMPGGLTRVSSSLDSLRLSLVEGHRSKDTWVLSDGPVAPITLLKTSDDDVPLRRGGADLPSRVAEQFFWLGRQAERAESLARLLRIVTLKLTSEADSASLVELPSLLRVLAEGGQIEPGFVVDEIKLAAAGDRAGAADLGVRRSAAARAAGDGDASSPTWARWFATASRSTRGESCGRSTSSSGRRRREPDLADMLEKLDGLLRNLSAFTGLVLENMTRTQAWQFLQLGRRLERCLQTCEPDPHHAARRRSDGACGARSAAGSGRQHHDLSLAVSGPRAVGSGARPAADRRIESAFRGVSTGQLRGSLRAVAARRERTGGIARKAAGDFAARHAAAG